MVYGTPPGYPGLDDGNVIQGHQVGAQESAVAQVVLSFQLGD